MNKILKYIHIFKKVVDNACIVYAQMKIMLLAIHKHNLNQITFPIYSTLRNRRHEPILS